MWASFEWSDSNLPASRTRIDQLATDIHGTSGLGLVRFRKANHPSFWKGTQRPKGRVASVAELVNIKHEKKERTDLMVLSIALGGLASNKQSNI